MASCEWASFTTLTRLAVSLVLLYRPQAFSPVFEHRLILVNFSVFRCVFVTEEEAHDSLLDVQRFTIVPRRSF